MYGSVPVSLEQEAGTPLLSKKDQRKKRSAHDKFVAAAHAVRGVERLKKEPTREKEGVFGNLFVEEKKPEKKEPVAAALVTELVGKSNKKSSHSFLYRMLNSKSHSPQAIVFKQLLSLVICVDVVMFILSTDPHFKHKKDMFRIEEGVSSTLFLIEYVTRLVVIMESKKYSHMGPIKGRLLYMTSWPAVIDALATFPFFLELVLRVEFPTLTYLRFLRLLRIQRTQSFSRAADCVVRVIYYNREILQVALIMCVYLVLFTAFLLYFCRPRNVKDGQDAEGFGSIGATMYMSTLMLTGQGGPEGDLPWYTKSIVLMTGVFSIGMFAIPASMLTWGFEAEAQRVAAKTRRRTKSKRSDSTLSVSSSYDTSSSGADSDGSLSTSDEEYLAIIAGEEDDAAILEGKSGAEQEALQELLDRFRQFDTDESGSLTKREFLELIENFKATYAPTAAPTDPLAPTTLDSAQAQHLVQRMNTLERKVDATNARLDKIYALLRKGNK